VNKFTVGLIVLRVAMKLLRPFVIGLADRLSPRPHNFRRDLEAKGPRLTWQDQRTFESSR
jgi:hypothetical protein